MGLEALPSIKLKSFELSLNSQLHYYYQFKNLRNLIVLIDFTMYKFSLYFIIIYGLKKQFEEILLLIQALMYISMVTGVKVPCLGRMSQDDPQVL